MKLVKNNLLLLIILFMTPQAVAAANPALKADTDLNRKIFSGLKKASEETFSTSKETAAGDVLLSQIFVQWMNIAIGVLGLVAVVLFVYAGYLWLTAGGESGPIQKAKTIIKRVVVGMIVVGMAYALVTFALGAFIPTGQLDNPDAKEATGEAADAR